MEREEVKSPIQEHDTMTLAVAWTNSVLPSVLAITLLCLPYSVAQICANYTYLYYTHVFWVHTYVNACTYVHIYTHICLFVMHSHKFLYEALLVKQKTIILFLWEWSEICILLKRHTDQQKLSYFEFMITSQIHWQTTISLTPSWS